MKAKTIKAHNEFWRWIWQCLWLGWETLTGSCTTIKLRSGFYFISLSLNKIRQQCCPNGFCSSWRPSPLICMAAGSSYSPYSSVFLIPRKQRKFQYTGVGSRHAATAIAIVQRPENEFIANITNIISYSSSVAYASPAKCHQHHIKQHHLRHHHHH